MTSDEIAKEIIVAFCQRIKEPSMTELTDPDGTMHAAKMGAALGELYDAVLKGVKKARV